MISRWWHERVLGHLILMSRVSVPMFDPGAKGYLWDCTCGKRWAE